MITDRLSKEAISKFYGSGCF